MYEEIPLDFLIHKMLRRYSPPVWKILLHASEKTGIVRYAEASLPVPKPTELCKSRLQRKQEWSMGYRSKMNDDPLYGKLAKLALPIAFQSLMLASVAAADALMLGSVQQDAMSAVSLATQIQFIQNMILSALVAGGTILGAQYWGKRDTDAIDHIFGMMLRWAMLISLLFFAACTLFPRYLMLIFTNEEVLIEIGIGYLRLAGWSYLLTGISQCCLAVMKISDHAREAAIISSGAVVINIIGNAVLIFGLLGFPALGVRGAAAATLLARIIELTWTVFTSCRQGFIRPRLRSVISGSRLIAGDYFKCVWPLLGASLFWGAGFTSYSAFMGHLGKDAAAANSVAAVVRDLVCCMCNGISAAAGIVVGNELGAGNLERGRRYGDRIAVLSFICGAASTVLMLLVTPILMHSVKLTDGARELLLGMMIIMAVYMVGRAVNTIIINGIFAAGGDTLFDLYSLAVTMWCLAIPLAAAGTFFLGWHPLIVYACTCLDEVGKIPWVILHYRRYKWVKDLTR